MKISTIDTGHFKLDGGAMFGVVPKSIWHKLNPADDNNMCSWAMRCLLVEDNGKLILIDTGMGDKQDAKFQGFYYRHGHGDLLSSIARAGYSPNEITDVILSHLHFDHCGGAVQWNTDRSRFQLTFPNARYWTHSEHWHEATHPNAREKATFLKDNIMPIFDSGQLYFCDQLPAHFGPNIDLKYADGHTQKMIMPYLKCNGKTVVFMADTVPSSGHLPLPYVMGYDVRPLQTMVEKEILLNDALANNHILVFDHDPLADCCVVEQTEKGIRVREKGPLSAFL